MSPEDREAHIRRMMAHAREEQEKLKRETEEFERGCRRFFEFMQDFQRHS